MKGRQAQAIIEDQVRCMNKQKDGKCDHICSKCTFAHSGDEVIEALDLSIKMFKFIESRVNKS